MVQGGFLEPTLDARYHRASMTQLPRPPTEALKRAFPDESLVAAWVPPAGLTSADSSDFRLAPRPQPAPQHLHATRRKIPKVSTERRVPKFDTQGESGSSGRRDYQSPPSDCSSAEAPPRGWSAAAPAAVAAVPEGEQPATCCAGQPSHVEPGTKQRPRSPRGSGTGSEEGWAPRPLAAPLARPRSTVAEGGSKLSDANGRAKASTGLHEINGNRPATSACERDEAEGNRQPRALLMESPPNDRFAGTAGPVAHGVSNASPSDDAEDPSVHPSPGDEREVAYEPAEHEIAATLNSLGDQSTKFANTKLVQELVDKYNKVSRRPALQVCTPEEFLEDYTLFHKVTGYGRDLSKVGRANGKRLDLFNLYKVTASLGGFEKTGWGAGINWSGQVFPKMDNFTENNKATSIGNMLITTYTNCLVEYEQVHSEDLALDTCKLCNKVHSDDGLDQWVDCKDCQAWFHYCCLAAPEEQSIRPRVRQAKIYAFKKYEMKNSPDYICTSCLRRDPSAVGGAPLAPKPMMARAVHPGAPRPLQCRNVQGLAPKPFQASPSNPAATKPAQRNTQLPGAPTRAQQVPAAPTAAPEPDQATDARAADPNPPKASVPLPAQAAAPVPWNRPDFKAAMKLAAARFEASLQAAPMYEQLVADGFNIAASRAWLSAHDAKPERLVLKVVPRDISNSAVHKSAMERVSKYCVDDAVTQKLAEAHRLTREAVQAGATQMLMDTLQALAHEMNGEDGMGVTVYNRGLLAKVLFKPPVQANCEPLDSNDADC